MSKKAALQIVKSDSKVQLNARDMAAKASAQAHHHGKGAAAGVLDPEEQSIQEDLAVLDEEVSDSVADQVILAQADGAGSDAPPAGAGSVQPASADAPAGAAQASGVSGETTAEPASAGVLMAAVIGVVGLAAAGGGGGSSPPVPDTTPPAAPVINTVAGNDIINAAETGVAITGTAEANSTVNLTLGGNVRTVTANGAGNWSYTLVGADITAMGEGAETLSATATDAAGNVSVAGTRAITIDTVAPAVTDANITITSAGSGTGGAYVAGDTVTAQWDNSAAGDNNADVAGVTMNFGAFGGGTAVAATETAPGSNIWTASYIVAAGTINGTTGLNVSVTATDTAGNTGTTADTTGLTVDNQVPAAPVINLVAGDDIINAAEAGSAITGTAEANATVNLTVGAGNVRTVTADGTGNWTYTLVGADITAMGEGAETLSATATDAAGNVSVAGTRAISVDTVVPTATAGIDSVWDNYGANQGALTTGGTTDDTSLVLGGSITPVLGAGEVVAVYDGTTRLGEATIGGLGNTWTYTDSTLVNGDAPSYTVRVEDTAGNQGTASTPAFTTTISAPTATAAITAVADNVGAIQTANLATGGVTDDTSLDLSGTITGTLGAGEVVAVYDGAAKLGNAIVGGGGTTWTYGDSTLANGDAVSYTVVVENAGGDQGTMSSPAFTTTIDTASPATPVIGLVAGDDIINAVETGSAITGTAEANSTVNLTVGAGNIRTVTADGTGNWTYTLVGADITAMGEGAETLSATATDAAGNVSVAGTRAINVDTVVPAAPVINLVAGDDIINAAETGGAITGTAEANATVNLTLGGNVHTVTADGTGNWTYTLVGADITAMGEGAETLSATATDAAGNVSVAGTRAISVDTVVPVAPVINAVAADDIINAAETGSAITGTAEANSTVNLTVGAGNVRTVTADGTGNWTYTLVGADITAMGEGAETLSATATDAAGNVSVAGTRAISVDTVVPAASVINAVATDDIINAAETGSAITGTAEANATVNLTVGAGNVRTVTADGTGNWTYTLVGADITAMGEGAETLSATATDAAGNVSVAGTRAITVDTIAPTVVDASFFAGATSFWVIYSEGVTATGPSGATAFLNSTTPLAITGASISTTINPNDTINLATGATLAATDYVVLHYNATLGSVTDLAGNQVLSGTGVFGSTGTLGLPGTTIDLTVNPLSSTPYFPVYIRTHQGIDTVTGTNGIDYIQTGRSSDTINGSGSADTISLSEGAAAMDTVVLQQGMSGAAYYDVIYEFDVTGTVNNDRLDVRSNNIAASTVGYVDGADSGTIMSHSIGTGGIVTFGSTNTGTPMVINAGNLNDALTYLRTNITNPGETVAFAADTDGIAGNDALFVYQNAMGWDTVAKLVDSPTSTVSTATLGTAAGTGVVQLYDHTAPEIEGGSFAGNTLTLTYSENIHAVAGTPGEILLNGAGLNIATAATITGGSTLNVTTSATMAQTDWLLMTTGTDFADATGNATTAQVVAFGGSGNNGITVTLAMNASMIMGNAGKDTITATASAERIEGGADADTINSGGGFDTFSFVQGDSTAVTYLDVGGSGTVNTGDTFTFTGGVDIINGAVSGSSISLDILSDTSTSMSWAAMSNTGQVGDQNFDAVRGDLVGSVFTVNTAAGADWLGVYDGNSAAAVSQTALVLRGVGALGLTPNGDQILIV